MRQPPRPGFLAECKALCERYDIPSSIVLPINPKLCLRDFAFYLKLWIYDIAFQTDVAGVKDSQQASTLAALFPPDTTYSKYCALDIMTRVLNGKDRELRTAFLHNLTGASVLTNHFVKRCRLCNFPNPNLAHYIFGCDQTDLEASQFLQEVKQYISRVNPHLATEFDKAITNSDRETIQKIVFGANYALDGELFRKEKSHSHCTVRICVLTAKFFARVTARAEQVEV